MSRFIMYIEYEGTRYRGWQYQKNVRSIQGELLKAARNIFKTDAIEIYGSGRTDAGVHAILQVAHLDVETMLAPEIIQMKFNDLLPHDISILEVAKTHDRFHARHDAVSRSYLYQISRRRTAFGKRFVWWIKDPLDVNRMKQAAAYFVGMNDFRSFTASEPDQQSTKVLLDECTITESGALILVRITGSHFIWKMVRQIIGTLVEVGRGAMEVEEVERFLRTHSTVPAQLTAPPSGLFLERVYYKNDTKLTEITPVLPVLSKKEIGLSIDVKRTKKRRRYDKAKL